MQEVLKIDRKSVEADPRDMFSLIDPNGMPWFGKCQSVEHGPKDYYAVTGIVTSAPTEWVGLTVVVFGHFHGHTMEVMPEPLYRRKYGPLSDRDQMPAHIAGSFEPEAFGSQK